MHKDEIAKGAFFALVNYCDENNKCEECIFFNDDTGCIFGSGYLPTTWELPDNT